MGDVDGHALGEVDGLALGLKLGNAEGVVDGLLDGLVDGPALGDSDGDVLGIVDGARVGDVDGDSVGLVVGSAVSRAKQRSRRAPLLPEHPRPGVHSGSTPLGLARKLPSCAFTLLSATLVPAPSSMAYRATRPASSTTVTLPCMTPTSASDFASRNTATSSMNPLKPCPMW